MSDDDIEKSSHDFALRVKVDNAEVQGQGWPWKSLLTPFNIFSLTEIICISEIKNKTNSLGKILRLPKVLSPVIKIYDLIESKNMHSC